MITINQRIYVNFFIIEIFQVNKYIISLIFTAKSNNINVTIPPVSTIPEIYINNDENNNFSLPTYQEQPENLNIGEDVVECLKSPIPKFLDNFEKEDDLINLFMSPGHTSPERFPQESEPYEIENKTDYRNYGDNM